MLLLVSPCRSFVWSLCFLYSLFPSHSFVSTPDNALLDAEWAVLKKARGDLRVKFEQAILLAGRRGLTNLQALSNERLAIYMEETGDDVEALYRYEQAVQLYGEWGAKAKVEQLQPKIESMDKRGVLQSSHSYRAR